MKLRTLRKPFVLSLVAAGILQLSACGTILHPERKGQVSGKLDAGIVVLDAIGLLFFVIPGVIAFAVDFSNGTIYLPGGTASIDTDSLNPDGLNKEIKDNVNVVKVDGEMTEEKIEKTILDNTGKKVSLKDSEVHSETSNVTLSALNRNVRYL
ncbi:MAG: hypothetical protein P1U57_09510 [Oleibacter sp.]|nr:hypothetical protein [Thalassolituus sp.]